MDNETNTQAGAAGGRKLFSTSHVTFYINEGASVRKEQRDYPYHYNERGQLEREYAPREDALGTLGELDASGKDVLISVSITNSKISHHPWEVSAKSKTAYRFRGVSKLPLWFATSKYAQEVRDLWPELH